VTRQPFGTVDPLRGAGGSGRATRLRGVRIERPIYLLTVRSESPVPERDGARTHCQVIPFQVRPRRPFHLAFSGSSAIFSGVRAIQFLAVAGQRKSATFAA
jgi:hypothetical protein